ncbi:type IV pili methyl-accepting chemotaxis transducer N-terminal domain-containing protein [Cellulophaga baltica]|uniref:type IV pili methyl-accepting chemotaxis transducer N-terminal domain-containing protein n=1 Tax=Cellulophaga TaxID=104264 RepID=UPI001C06B321|nr:MULTISPECIES: type IV pili methyl-accepting chemotaxis transducer N-terminal domain-containing protein [Cellulophaga]MBU2997433.1 type IV pili methyl-accepting chemotaxis transducer N-terminal domain-containing protein [Cellulophaga baltica]MDO6768830.1 type IV pili methyl-accepting chemotaxis transducer N-terminal domain-containing protein [Cellulophaga sp. 1_MG-2023]
MKFKFSNTTKKFYRYYLLVLTIIVLTILIQSIIQYSLKKQEQAAYVINMSGRQRMLSQLVLKDFYECKFQNCDYSEMRIALNKLNRTNTILQKGDEGLGVYPLDNEEIQTRFNDLKPYLDHIYTNLSDFDNFESIDTKELATNTDSFLEIMDNIVYLFQRQSEEEIKTIMIVELELAVFSLIIILFEIFFIVNPVIKKITNQNNQLKEISWHQSHAFNSHMKNIKDLQHVLKIEKKIENQKDIVDCVVDELNDLSVVSENMLKSLEKE